MEQDTKYYNQTIVSPILDLASLLRRSAADYYTRELGLSYFDWRVILHVGESQPLALSELASLMNLDRGQLSRGITRLAEAGLLVRRKSEKSRGPLVSVTDRGQQIYEELTRRTEERHEKLVENITSEELPVFFHVLETIAANARRLAVGDRNGEADGEG